MKTLFIRILLLILLVFSLSAYGQTDSLIQKNDSINSAALQDYNKKLRDEERKILIDSIKKAELEGQLLELKTTDHLQKADLLEQLRAIEESERTRIASKKLHIDSLRNTVVGYPVTGAMGDTLFLIYAKIGSSTPSERAVIISGKIRKLYEDDFLKTDSIRVIKSESTYDIVSRELIIMSVSENDALWSGKDMPALADEFCQKVKDSIETAKSENSWLKITIRIGLVLLVIAIAWLVFWLVGRGYSRLLRFIDDHRGRWIKDLSYKDYTFLSAEQEMHVLLVVVKTFRWFVYALLLYITLPIIFSIFPFSRDWAGALVHLIWSPFRSVFLAFWHYLPDRKSVV